MTAPRIWTHKVDATHLEGHKDILIKDIRKLGRPCFKKLEHTAIYSLDKCNKWVLHFLYIQYYFSSNGKFLYAPSFKLHIYWTKKDQDLFLPMFLE